jgi:hypothetical protein
MADWPSCHTGGLLIEMRLPRRHPTVEESGLLVSSGQRGGQRSRRHAVRATTRTAKDAIMAESGTDDRFGNMNERSGCSAPSKPIPHQVLKATGVALSPPGFVGVSAAPHCPRGLISWVDKSSQQRSWSLQLVIHSVYNGYWFWGRPSTEDLRHDLREVTREIRTHWDPTSPGLRENYESGDRAMHDNYVEADLRPKRG